MMHFHIMTLFPDMVMAGLGTSITGRAIAKGLSHRGCQHPGLCFQ